MRLPAPLRRLWSAGLPPRGTLFALAVTGLLASFLVFALWLYPRSIGPWWHGAMVFNDNYAQWSFARFAMQNPAAGLYDPVLLHEFQVAHFPRLRLNYPYPYPPHYLFAVWPLGWLDPWIGWPVWTGATFLLFLLAAQAGRWHPGEAGFLLLAPLSVLTAAYGQNGFLTSALILGALRLLPRHAIPAGILLGLATIKPQLGVLIPFALLAARQWTALAAAAATTAALVLVSAAAFGWEPWRLFLEGLASHAGSIDDSVGEYRKATLSANLVLAGMPRPAAYAVQAAAGAAMAVLVWRVWRRGVSPAAIALLIVAGFLATPYAFFYDLPMLTPAILMLARTPSGRPRRLAWPEAAAIGTGLLFPITATMTSRLFWTTSLGLSAVLALALWQARTVGKEGR